MKKQTSILLLLLTFWFANVGNASAQKKHKYVDLGLPSGTLWATCNVGANNPEDYGDYFAWGETTTKSTYSWSTYKYCRDGNYHKLTKYCDESGYGNNGFTDGKRTLDPSDDAATANWGDGWCMPTTDQITELNGKCTWNWTSRNGKNGYEVIGPNGNRLFLPAAGYRNGTDRNSVGAMGRYWTREFFDIFLEKARDLQFDSSYVSWLFDYRYYGYSVRPVRCSD